jgi:hypothetical protein
MPSPFSSMLKMALSPSGRKAIGHALRVARTEEGQKLIAQARQVATGPEGRKLIAHAKVAARSAGQAAKTPDKRTQLDALVDRLRKL